MKFLTAIVVLAMSILLPQSGIAADKSIEALRKAVEQGNALAQNYLGEAYERGDGVPRDIQEAARLYRLAADQGNADGQSNLGWAYAAGEGVPRDMKEAARLFRLAAEQGNASAQYNLGLMYDKGIGVLQNKNEAVNWYRKAAAQGQKEAQKYFDGLNVAQPAIQTGVAPTAQKAEQSLREIRKAAEQGNAADQFKRGLAYERGEGVPRDKKEAARLYRLAAEQGYALAQLYLGWAYEYRDGVPRDMKEAARLYRLAAEQGNADAQNALGRAYSNGEGVPQDKKEAERWYAKAAKQGNATAQSDLANHQEQRKAREDAARGAPQWADADNGAYINWNDAKAYCARKGRGWRLPTVAELQGNHDKRCWDRICFVSKSRLTGSEFWSIELYDDSSTAWGIDSHGRRISLNVGDRGGGALALCVRRP